MDINKWFDDILPSVKFRIKRAYENTFAKECTNTCGQPNSYAYGAAYCAAINQIDQEQNALLNLLLPLKHIDSQDWDLIHIQIKLLICSESNFIIKKVSESKFPPSLDQNSINEMLSILSIKIEIQKQNVKDMKKAKQMERLKTLLVLLLGSILTFISQFILKNL